MLSAKSSGRPLLVFPHSLAHRDEEKGLDQRRAALEPLLRYEFVSVFLRHVAEGGVNKRI
jgi:hypothetical protein